MYCNSGYCSLYNNPKVKLSCLLQLRKSICHVCYNISQFICCDININIFISSPSYRFSTLVYFIREGVKLLALADVTSAGRGWEEVNLMFTTLLTVQDFEYIEKQKLLFYCKIMLSQINAKFQTAKSRVFLRLPFPNWSG